MTRRSAFWSQYFYFFMSLLVAAVLVYGFSQTIDQNLIHPKIPRPPLLYFHAALFTGWPVFFILQSLLVRTHNVRIHRTIGWFGVGMGALIPLVGVATAVTMARFDMMQLKMNNADADMIIPMWDMVAFTPAFVLAWISTAPYYAKTEGVFARHAVKTSGMSFHQGTVTGLFSNPEASTIGR